MTNNILSLLTLASLLVSSQLVQAQTYYPAPATTAVQYGVPRNYADGRQDSELDGDIIMNNGSRPHSQCKTDCNNLDGCVGYVEFKNNGGCGYMSSVKSYKTNQGGSRAYLMRDRMWKKYSGYGTGDTGAAADFWASSEDDCRRKCAENFQCVAVEFTSTQMCKLKTGFTDPSVNSNSAVHLMSEFNNDDGGFTFTSPLYDVHGPLQRDDRLVSPGKKAALRITGGGSYTLNWLGVPVMDIAQDVTRVGVLSNGRYFYDLANGNRVLPSSDSGGGSCNQRSVGSWRLVLDDNMMLQTINSDGQVCFKKQLETKSEVKYWAWKDMVGEEPNLEGNFDLAQFSPNGAHSVVYFVDSGMSNDWDASGQMISRYERLPAFNKDGVNTDQTDYISHGSTMFQLAKNHRFGIMFQGKVMSAKVTEGQTNTISERAVVRAMQSIYNSYNADGRNKIVNFSGFFEGSTRALDCAIQWLFYDGTSVVTAAGNGNDHLGTRNVYSFTVGAYSEHPGTNDGMIHSLSNHGPGVDLFAPGSFMNPVVEGTSVASAFTAIAMGVIASEFKNHPNSMWNNPDQIYAYVNRTARTNMLSSANTKTSRNGRRTLSLMGAISGATTPNGATYLTSTDKQKNYCAELDSNLPKESPSATAWTTLINRASTTPNGATVTTRFKPSCPGCG